MENKAYQRNKTEVQCAQTAFVVDHLRSNDTSVNRVFLVLDTKPPLICSGAGDIPTLSRSLDRCLPESPPRTLLWLWKCLSGAEVTLLHN